MPYWMMMEAPALQIPYIAFGDVEHHRYLSMTVPRFTVDELAKMLSYYRYAPIALRCVLQLHT